MDDKYIDDKNLFVTKAFYNYAAPLVGELPAYASLKIKKASPRAGRAKPAARRALAAR
jgi:hypothetical protein